MRAAVLAVVVLAVSSCAEPPPRQRGVDPTIKSEIDAAAQAKRETPPAPIDQALLPPLRMDMPAVGGQPIDARFDLSVNNAPAAQVFNSIVAGTRYSMLVHPSVGGSISVNLKDVTVREALDSIRELYGYEYKIEGNRIFIQPVAIQTRVFNVNYLIGQRLGRSDVRVTSGSVADAPATPGIPGIPGSGLGIPTAVPTTPGGVTQGVLADSSRITTQTKSDFWEELEKTLKAVVGDAPGRSVVVNPQAGIAVVRAMPVELRAVENYLKAIRSSVERQVLLEAKIVEVTLSSEFQTGVNWAAFSGNRLSAGPVSQGTLLQQSGPLATGATGIAGATTGTPQTISGAVVGSTPGSSLINFTAPGASLFGLAFQTSNFAALLTFLETQGAVQVLSSPRIATINNQKAVLKVGTDQFFLTNISGSTQTTSTVTTTGTTVPAFPTITLRPFFSGVALDITPRIDEESNIILHVHPSVSDVQTDDRQIDLGSTFGGPIKLPLARSTVSETDSVVKAGDGNIVAIGGLMKVDVEDSRSGLPGVQDAPVIGGLFRSTTRTYVKKELVILIKPTVVQTGADTLEDIRQARERIMNLLPPPPPRAERK